MKFYWFLFCLVVSIFNLKAQERFLIEETDSIQLYETYLSNTSKGNVFPSIYNNGLLFVSNNYTKDYKLFYSDLQSDPIKIAIGNRLNFGAVSVFDNEIYFSGVSRKPDYRGYYNSTIYKGIVEGTKVSKIEKLPFCDKNFSYTDPFISKDGKKLLVVSSEKHVFHIIEFVKNELSKWVKKSVVFISHPNFDIINPTIFDENTVYFSSNIFKGKITGATYATNAKGEIVIDQVKREEGDFNIYKIVRTNGIWGLPLKAHEFNSPFDELGVLFDSDKSGYLTSFRYNSNDNIYYFILK